MAVKTLLGGWGYILQYSPEEIVDKAVRGQSLPRGLSRLEAELKRYKCEGDEARTWEVISEYIKYSDNIIVPINSLIKADITNEEASLASKFCGHRGLHVGGIGYLDPKRIISYYCGKCDKEYECPPKIEIFIGEEFGSLIFDDKKKIGSVIGMCNTCNEAIIHICPVWDGQNPDPKYIFSDHTGKFIRPTPESIEKVLAEVQTQANNEGKFDGNLATRAGKWAAIINYDLGNKIAELEKLAAKRDVELYEQNLGKTIDYIYNRIKNRMGGEIHIFVDEGSGYADPNDESCVENIEKLLIYLPKVKVPEEPATKEKLSFILSNYQKNILEKRLDDIKTEKTNLDLEASRLNAKRISIPKV